MEIIGKKLAHRLSNDYWTPWCMIGKSIDIRAQILPTRESYNYLPVQIRQGETVITLRYPQFFILMKRLGYWYRDEQPDFMELCVQERNVLKLDGKDKMCHVTQYGPLITFSESFCRELWVGCPTLCKFGCANCRLIAFACTYFHICENEA